MPRRVCSTRLSRPGRSPRRRKMRSCPASGRTVCSTSAPRDRAQALPLIHYLAGLVLGLACVIGGILLFFHGVVGASSWVGEVIGVKSQLSDAAPGTVLFVVGLAVVFLPRFSARVRQPIEIDLSDRRDLPDRRRKAG